MTTPAAFAPALAAWLATPSSEAAATFAIAAISSRSPISPALIDPSLSMFAGSSATIIAITSIAAMSTGVETTTPFAGVMELSGPISPASRLSTPPAGTSSQFKD
jgi:hypothetical protein